ncbi:MAG: hypothetical protein AB7P23_13130, partial [Amphiplicatus sp.]
MQLKVTVAAAAAILASSCATPVVKTTPLSPADIAGAASERNSGALEYYLPRQRVKITAKGYSVGSLVPAAAKDVEALK